MMTVTDPVAHHTLPTPVPLQLLQAQVVVSLAGHAYLLDDGRLARQAASCLLLPEVGDSVLTVTASGETSYILHVLQRSRAEPARISVPGASHLLLEQEQISLHATDTIALQALHDVEIGAATGTLRLNAVNLFASVQQSMVQHVGQFIGKARQYLLAAEHLLHLKAQHTVIDTEKDVKVDGERISLG